MAESKGLYQPWRHEAFMADRKVRKMTPIELKTYMLLLHEAFVCETRPNLPGNEDILEEMALCTSHEEWLSVRESVLGMFEKAVVDNVPVLTRKRLTDDWDHLQEIREARSEAGKASAAKRKSTNVERLLTNEHKEVSKKVNKKISEEGDADMNLKKLKESLTIEAVKAGAKIGGYDSSWSDIKILSDAHGSGAVITDFAQWLQEERGGDFPKGALVSYLRMAAERLVGDTAPTAVVAKDPAVLGLTREFAYLSDGKVTFQARQKVALSVLLETYSAEELVSVFQSYLETKDLDDPYVLKFITQNFLDAADSLADTARRRRNETEAAKVAREAAVARLQAEAEAEREKVRAAENIEVFDPLSSE